MPNDEAPWKSAPRTYRPLQVVVQVQDADGNPVAAAAKGAVLYRTRNTSELDLIQKIGAAPGTIVVSVESR